MARLLVYARPGLTNCTPGATGGGHHAKRWSASAFLLLEGSWPEDPPPAAYCSLDDAIDGRFDWVDQQAADLAELLGGADAMLRDPAGPPDRISPAYLNALALRYYLVKLIRPLAYLSEVQPLRPGDHLELVAAAGRDADYAEVLSQFCRAAGVHYCVRWVEGSTPLAGRFPANRLWRRCLARLGAYFQPAEDLRGSGRRVVLCGNPRLLDPVCRELLARGCRLWWLCDRFAVRLWLRWGAAGVRQLTCNASLGRDGEKGTGTFCAQHPSGRSGKRFLSPFRLECRGVNLAGAVRRWLAERLATCGPHQTRLIEQIDADFRRVRPDALVLDEDATPLARAAVAVGRRYGAGSFVVQHGVPYCRFGFSPPAADRVLVWGESSRQRLIEWGVPAEQIRLTGSPQHDDLRQELQRLDCRGLPIRRQGRPQCATASSEAVPGVELVPKPLTPDPSPRRPLRGARGEGRTFWDRFVTRLHGLPCGKPWHTEEVRRTRILLLTTVPPRDDRPDAVALHLTGRTYARMLRTAFAAVARIDGAELVVKLHPRSGDDPTVRALQAEFRSVRTRLVRRGRLEEWLSGVSCVLSCGSSAGVEATLAGVPVIQLAPPGASGFLPHEPWGLAGTARNEAELRTLLAQLATDGWRAPPGPDPNVFAGLDRSAAARIANEVLAPRAQSDRTTTHARRARRAEADRQALPAGYC